MNLHEKMLEPCFNFLLFITRVHQTMLFSKIMMKDQGFVSFRCERHKISVNLAVSTYYAVLELQVDEVRCSQIKKKINQMELQNKATFANAN